MKFKILVTIAMVSLVSTANAQPQQPVTPAEYVLKVKPADIDKIGKGLAKLPFEEVADLMQALRQQVFDQQQPKQTEEKK